MDAETVIALLGALSIGSVVTLGVTAWLDRRKERRLLRREFYIDTLAMWIGRQRALYRLSWDVDGGERLVDIDEDKLDHWNARNTVDASPEVRDLAEQCNRSMHKFWQSYEMRAPIEVDQFGMFHYRFDLVRDQPDDQRELVMRVALGQFYNEFRDNVTKLGERIRVELNGRT